MSKSKQNRPRPQEARAESGRAGGPSASRREQLRQQQAAEAQRARTRRIITVAGIVLAVAIVAFVIVVLVQNAQRERALQEQHGTGEQIVPPNANAERTGIQYGAGKAAEDAPLVDVFMDFQCGGCAQASQVVDPKLEALADAGEINLVYHMLYGMDPQPNGNSFRANVAASCADNYGSFIAYQQQVFGQVLVNQQLWNDTMLRDEFPLAAGIAGDDLAAFQSCFDNKSTSEFVEGVQAAKPEIITQTPSFLVNGKLTELYSAAGSEQTLLEAIKAAA